MIEKAAAGLTSVFRRHGIISDDSRDIYIYGFDLALSSALNLALILVLAFLYGRPLDAVIYTVCTRPLRTYGGGWHANTHALCMTLHAAAFSVVSWLCHFLWRYITLPVVGLLSIAMIVIVLLKAPVEHPDNPLGDEARKNARKKSIEIALCLCVAAFTVYVFGFHYTSALVALSSVSATLTLLIGNTPT